MTDAERQFVIDQLHGTSGRLHAAAQAMDAEAWLRRPAPDLWSPCLCVEHIVIVEGAVLAALQRAVDAAAPSPPALRARAEGKDSLVLRAVADRSRKVASPEPLAPPGRLRPEAALAAFDQVRARSIAFAASTSAALRDYVWPHPFLKELDGYQWLLFIALHGLRHTLQLEEAAGSRGSKA